MIRYEEFRFPKEYENIPKNKLFNEFINFNNAFIDNIVIGTIKIIPLLKQVIDESDSNELTWWKLYLKVELIMAETSESCYLAYTINKILENINIYEIDELPKLIINFNSCLSAGKNLSVFTSKELNLCVFREKETPDYLLKMYNHRDYIKEVLNQNIPKSAFNLNNLKIMVGSYFIENFSELDFINLMKDSLYKEAFVMNKFDKDNIKSVCKHLLKESFLKKNPLLIDNIWSKLKDFFESAVTEVAEIEKDKN